MDKQVGSDVLDVDEDFDMDFFNDLFSTARNRLRSKAVKAKSQDDYFVGIVVLPAAQLNIAKSTLGNI